MVRRIILSLIIGFMSFCANAQEDLLSLVDSLADPSGNNFVQGTFKGTRVINGHSVESPAAGDLHFLISHRFGTINKGVYEFFGLDQATIRLGLDYGITDQLTIGYGRSSLQKTYDGYVKYKVLRQREDGKMPFTAVWFSSIAMNTMRFSDYEKDYMSSSSRFSYTHQLLIARKFSERISLQLSPTLVHRNFVETAKEENNVFAIGAAGRFKISRRVALTTEYFYVLSPENADLYKNSFSIGFDIETGGHVFQLHITNAQGMIEKFYIPATTAAWDKKEIYFGFNISRVFTLTNKDKKKSY